MLSCTCKRLSKSINVEERRVATRPFMQLVVYDPANPYVAHVASQAEPSMRVVCRSRPSRAKVPGRGRGRPPNSSYSSTELESMKRQRAQKRQEELDRWNQESRAREDEDDTYARSRGFADASFYRRERHSESLPCGHSGRRMQYGPLRAEADGPGTCSICGRAHGEFNAAVVGAGAEAVAGRASSQQRNFASPNAAHSVLRASGTGHTPVTIGGRCYRTCTFCETPGHPYGRADTDGQWYCKRCWAEWDPSVPSCDVDCTCKECR